MYWLPSRCCFVWCSLGNPLCHLRHHMFHVQVISAHIHCNSCLKQNFQGPTAVWSRHSIISRGILLGKKLCAYLTAILLQRLGSVNWSRIHRSWVVVRCHSCFEMGIESFAVFFTSKCTMTPSRAIAFQATQIPRSCSAARDFRMDWR